MPAQRPCQQQPQQKNGEGKDDARKPRPIEEQLAARVPGQPRKGADAEGCGPGPESGATPLCRGRRIHLIHLHQERYQRQAAPAIKLKIDVHRHPSTISPWPKPMIQSWKQQQDGQKHTNEICRGQPRQAVPSGCDEHRALCAVMNFKSHQTLFRVFLFHKPCRRASQSGGHIARQALDHEWPSRE